jgi:hypothetical protein
MVTSTVNRRNGKHDLLSPTPPLPQKRPAWLGYCPLAYTVTPQQEAKGTNNDKHDDDTTDDDSDNTSNGVDNNTAHNNDNHEELNLSPARLVLYYNTCSQRTQHYIILYGRAQQHRLHNNL